MNACREKLMYMSMGHPMDDNVNYVLNNDISNRRIYSSTITLTIKHPTTIGKKLLTMPQV